ncbi:MAG: thioredoxin-like domain-containing protein [Bacteroidota bacterium]
MHIKFKHIILISCWFTLLNLSQSFAQMKEFSVSGQIKGVASQTLTLSLYHGDGMKAIDSVKTDEQGNFLFVLKGNTPRGMYNLAYGKPFSDQNQTYQLQSFDLVFNNESVRLNTYASAPYDSLKVVESEECHLWYDYLKQKETYQKRIDQLNSIQQFYPVHNKFYEQLGTEVQAAKKDFKDYLTNLFAKNNSMLATVYINCDFPVVAPDNLTPNQLNDYHRTHFWDHVDFTDSMIVYSNLYAKKIIAWFALFNNRNWDKIRVENEFITATEILMKKAQLNPAIFDFSTYYLFDGFDKLGFSMALCKLASFNTDESCSEKQFSDYFAEQINSYNILGIGKTAPNIQFINSDGNEFRLSDIKSEYVLLIFWGTWCPHCDALLPKIRALYTEGLSRSKLDILAFAIDTSKTAFYETIKKNKYDWYNTTDLKGWESPMVTDFHIFATPTLFLLDKNRKIISRPTNFEQLLRKLKTIIQP